MAALIALLSGAVSAQDGARSAGEGQRPPRHASRSELESLLARMTLEQKVGQMFMVGLWGTVITEDGARFLREYQPGAVVVFSYNVGNAATVTQLINEWQGSITGAGGLPLLVAIDQEGGRINTLEEAPFTQFPLPALVTATGNHDLAYRFGWMQSQELRAVGIQMNLSPVADLETNPNNPVIFRRSFGSDPYMVAPTLSAVVQGMQDAGVIATLKHFPGHGDTNEDSHVELPVLPYDLAALQSLELIPFEAGIAAGAETVMVGHLSLPAIEPTPNLPASLSRRIITDLLRNQMGFEGIIMTDAMDMDAIDTRYPMPVAVGMAISAGVDLVAFGPHVGTNTMAASIDAVVAQVRAGNIPMSQIDASVMRILSAKQRYGVLDWQPLDPLAATQRVLEVGSPLFVESLYSAGVTLVYDREGLLPLPQNNRIGLLYPFNRIDVLESCVGANPQVQLVGFRDFPTEDEIASAQRLADGVDALIVFTQNAIDNPDQARLINALPADKTIVVAYWSPYDLQVFNRRPSAYIATYSPARAGVQVACRVLFGEMPARGKLPIHLGEDLLAASGAGFMVR